MPHLHFRENCEERKDLVAFAQCKDEGNEWTPLLREIKHKCNPTSADSSISNGSDVTQKNYWWVTFGIKQIKKTKKRHLELHWKTLSCMGLQDLISAETLWQKDCNVKYCSRASLIHNDYSVSRRPVLRKSQKKSTAGPRMWVVLSVVSPELGLDESS